MKNLCHALLYTLSIYIGVVVFDLHGLYAFMFGVAFGCFCVVLKRVFVRVLS